MNFDDIKSRSISELKDICEILRKRILEVVSANGGHLSSNLGAVEVSVAMHYVFDISKDPFIFDVSHQSYAHKLLTGRWEEFASLRTFGGMSGYTKPCESALDYFVAGHSSTSISLAVGAAKAIALKKEDRLPVALIGDGALTGGMAYEALNELGEIKLPCVIVLNDNEMSISKPIGAISNFLSQKMAGQFYQKFKSRVIKMLEYMPDAISYMARRAEEGFRLITPGMFFEEMGLDYIGPVDGHDLNSLISAFKTARQMKKPVVVHVQTVKGKGYKFSEGDMGKWHGVGAFDVETGESLAKKSDQKSATQIFSEELLEIAEKNERVVGLTAAMPSGTGMERLIERFPERFWDVAIAEQHAVTSMAAMAKEGFKPFVAIYSTFLQRAYDQVIHDVAILSMPVVFCMDRAGLVGEDGETHQGAFDVSYLNAVPNLAIAAPRDEVAFRALLRFGATFDKPLALRYPRGSFTADVLREDVLREECAKFESVKFAKGQVCRDGGGDFAFVCFGDGFGDALGVAREFKEAVLVDLVFVKPLDAELLVWLSQRCKTWFVFSQSARRGGVGEILAGFLQEKGICGVRVVSFEFDDCFVTHGKTELVKASLGLDTASLVSRVRAVLEALKVVS